MSQSVGTSYEHLVELHKASSFYPNSSSPTWNKITLTTVWNTGETGDIQTPADIDNIRFISIFFIVWTAFYVSI